MRSKGTVRVATFLFGLFLLLHSVQVQAQEKQDSGLRLGPRIGVDVNNGNRLFVGADSRIIMGGNIVVNPTFDYHFIEGNSVGVPGYSANMDAEAFQLSVNMLYPVDLDLSVEELAPYIGGGVSFTRVSATMEVVELSQRSVEDDSDVQPEFAVIGGAEFKMDSGNALFWQIEIKIGPRFELFGLETQGGDFMLLTAGLMF